MTKEYLETILTEYGVAFTDSLADRLLKEFEPCEDAISRVETVKFLANHSNEFEDKKIRMAFQSASSLVNNPHNLPPVNPQPKTGRWRKVSMDKYIRHATYYYECSECGNQHIGHANYCPNCGAKMQEVKDES